MYVTKSRIAHFTLAILASVVLVGCSSVPLRTEASTSAISAAEAVGAAAVPQAALHLQLAREQLDLARALAARGKQELAELMLNRVVADAQLAVLLASEKTVRQEAEAAIALVQELRQKNKLPQSKR